MEKRTFKINKKLLSKEKKIEIVGDVIVPDVKPDIVNIIHVGVNPFIHKEDIMDGKLRIEGVINSNIIYLSDNGENRCIESEFCLLETIEDSDLKEGIRLRNKVDIDIVESKILNERKLQVRIFLTLKYDAFFETECSICEYNDLEMIEKLETSYDIETFCGFGKAKTSIVEELKITNEQIAEIFKVNYNLKNFENKVSNNKVLSKADLEVKIVYLTENGEIKFKEECFPVMGFIDVEGANEGLIVETEYKMKTGTVKINDLNLDVFNIEAEFEIEAYVYKKETINIIEDMYSQKDLIKIIKDDEIVNVFVNKEKELINFENKLDLEGASSIIDVDTFIKVISKKADKVEAEIMMDVFYFVDSSPRINVKTFKIPFDFRFKNTVSKIEQVKFNVLSKSVSLLGQVLSYKVDIEVEYTDEKYKKVVIIKDIEIEERKQEDYTMQMYFVKPEDTLWNIAKKFNIKKENIMDVNDIKSEEDLRDIERIYIVK